ncbi:MAG TPA: TonB-dependent receptor [Parvularculaceae bacterium]|nr:TonB-dependent receptor [Parvularculaceae bacterium]
MKPNTLSRRAAMLLAGVALPISAPAFAQSVDGSAANEYADRGEALDTVVVTAMRREENLAKVPASITALNGITLEKLDIDTTEDLSQYTPSLHIYAEAVGSEKYTIRGIGRTSEDLSADPGVALFLNDVYIPRQAAANLAFFDIERVEVLRGPQGSLYGKNATAGAINVISRQPTEEFSGYGEISYGSYDRITGKGAISGPLVEEKLYARVAFLTDDRDGLYKNLTTGETANDINTRAARAILKFTPTDQFTATLTGDWAKSKQNGVLKSICHRVVREEYIFFTNNPVTGLPRPGVTPPTQETDLRTARSGINGRQGIETYGGSLNMTYAANGFDIVSITGVRTEESYNQEDNGRAQEITSYNTTAEDTWSGSQEIRLVSTASNEPGDENRFSWTLGVYAFHEEGSRETAIYRNIAPFSGIADFKQSINTDALAVFAEAKYRLLDRVGLTAGVRYTTEEKELQVDAIATRIPGIPAGGPITPFIDADYVAKDSKRWNRVTPRVVLDVYLADDAMMYASVSKGFKSGGFQGTPPAPPLNDFSPEDVMNYELGFKGAMFDSRVQLSGAIFYSDYKNLQLQTFDVNGAPTTATASARSKGIEVEISALLSPGFTVNAGASFVDPEYKDYIAQQPGFSDPAHTFDRSGERIGGVPRYNLFLRADYRHSLGGAGDLVFSGSVVAVDDVVTEFNTLWANEYAKGDIRVSWESPDSNWVVSGWVKNVTDTTYYRGGGPVSKYETDKIRLGLINDPRTFGASVRRSF